MNRISVLLSTYNGMRFLDQQMDSLLAQSYRPAAVNIRDDGSSDGTRERLEYYASVHQEVKLIRGRERLGAARSFLELLSLADDCDYFSFCDQDDFWCPEKTQNAVELMDMHSANIPLMYFSRLEYVDSDLRQIGYSSIPKDFDYPNALVQNVATGCTVVINRSARELLLGRMPSRVFMHDWWCYLVLSAFGLVIFDDRAAIKYRLHGANVIGAPTNIMQQFKRRVSRFLSSSPGVTLIEQIREFEACFGADLTVDKRRILARFLAMREHWWSRLAYAVNMDVQRQTAVDNLFLRLLIAIGRI